MIIIESNSFLVSANSNIIWFSFSESVSYKNSMNIFFKFNINGLRSTTELCVVQILNCFWPLVLIHINQVRLGNTSEGGNIREGGGGGGSGMDPPPPPPPPSGRGIIASRFRPWHIRGEGGGGGGGSSSGTPALNYSL